MEDIIEIDLEVYKNLDRMLKSGNPEDEDLAVETIKNINPSGILIKLFVKGAAYGPRRKLLSLMGESSIWGYQDLTMVEIYNDIKKLDHPNIENIKEIYSYLVEQHFNVLMNEYKFIDSQFKIKW